MPDLLAYAGLVGANAMLLIWIIRWRGGVSFEGVGCILLLFVFGSDLAGLAVGYLVAPYPREIVLDLQGRFYPTLVHLAGVAAFAVGLAVMDPRPAPVGRDLDERSRVRIGEIARFLLLLGLCMKAVSMYAAGVRSIGQYLTQLYLYTFYQATFGGFLDKGPIIANLGLALLAAIRGSRVSGQVPYVLAMGATSFALSTSRADLLVSLLMYVLVAATLNQALVRSVLAHRWRVGFAGAALAALVVVNAGVKSQLRVREGQRNQASTTFNIGATLLQGGELFAGRFSQEGLYDGYANMVNRLDQGPARFFHGDVLTYAATAWVPFVIYRNKPQHPFRDTGDLFYDDYHSLLEDVSAPMLVGTAYADFGLGSVIAYLILYGVVLAAVRRFAAGRNAPVLLFVWYLHFVHVDGATNIIHGGIMNLIDAAALATGVLLVASVGGPLLGSARPVVAVQTPAGEAGA